MSAASGSSSRSAARRLIKELDAWRVEARDEKGIERLGPVSEDDLLAWEAVFNGRGISGGYEGKTSMQMTTSMNILLPPPPLPQIHVAARPED